MRKWCASVFRLFCSKLSLSLSFNVTILTFVKCSSTAETTVFVSHIVMCNFNQYLLQTYVIIINVSQSDDPLSLCSPAARTIAERNAAHERNESPITELPHRTQWRCIGVLQTQLLVNMLSNTITKRIRAMAFHLFLTYATSRCGWSFGNT